MTKETATLLVERSRTHYARSHGDTEWVRVAEPLAIDLGLPTSYAKDLLASLLAALQRGVVENDGVEQAQIAIDVPFRLHLRPIQVEQLIEKLAEISP